jgi:hypothetical protein
MLYEYATVFRLQDQGVDMQIRATDGMVVAGHGGPGIWVDGVMILPPSAGNDPAWCANGILCNDENSQLVIVNTSGTYKTLLDDRGASRIAADPDAPLSTNWAAFLQDGRTGIYTSWGLSVPAGELYGMRGGALFGRQNFQSSGGLCAWQVGTLDPNSILWEMSSAVVVEFSALDAYKVLWTDGARAIHVFGLPQPAQTAYCFAPKIFEVGGALFLCEWRDGAGLVVRPWDDADHGWILYAGEAFGACGVVTSDTQIALAWSLNIAEQGPVTRAVLDVTTPMVSLVPVPPKPEPQPPEPEPQPPEPEPQPPEPEPQPPEPEPGPEPPKPEPQPPKEKVVQISLDSVQQFVSDEVVTEVPHPDGQGLVALQTKDGKYKSLAPGGTWDPDKDSAGAWERFFPQGGVYLAYREDSNQIYSVAVITEPIPYQSDVTSTSVKTTMPASAPPVPSTSMPPTASMPTSTPAKSTAKAAKK